MKFLSNISFLFRDRKNQLPLGEQWRKLLLQISDIVENYILVFYNKLTKWRLPASCILHPASCILHPATCNLLSFAGRVPLLLLLVPNDYISLQTSMLRIHPAVIEKIFRRTFVSNKPKTK